MRGKEIFRGLALAAALIGATCTDTPRTAEVNASPSASASGETAKPSATTATKSVEPSAAVRITTQINPAEKVSDGVYKLQHPDEDDKTIEVKLPEGFTPDKKLHLSTDITALQIGDLNQYGDFEKALDTGRPVGDRLAGYNYDYNDFCQVPEFYCNMQLDIYSWRVLQGEEVRVPGIGTLKGSERRSVVLLIINLADNVKAYDVEKNGPVYTKRGFTATGREFDGSKVDQTERNLSGHWLYRQANGTPEKSYIGITDSVDNARETLLVTVVRKQWGNNPDGSKRFEDQLVRAEIVKLK